MIYLTHAKTLSTQETTLIDNIGYPQRIHWFPWSYKNIKTGLVCPPHKLAEQVLDKDIISAVKNKECKTAFILAAGNGNFAAEGRKLAEENQFSYQYKFLPLSLTQIYAGRIASMFGKIDYVVTDSSACASSLKVLMDVQTLIEMYKYDRVVVLGVEDQVNNMTLQFFGESGASLTEQIANEHNVVPSAFDDENFGFYLGQGAVLAVFESERVASKTPLARLVSAYVASESDANAIGQREDGQGFVDAMLGCMQVAGVGKEAIQIVKTHGTGTKSNNQAEKTALMNTLYDFVATSYKPMIGHTMGASGLLESVLLLQSSTIPAIPNRTKKDSIFLSDPMDKPKGLMLSLSAGMGNIYAAAIFEQG
jgi:3-oxoacyl-(acyl-carrier-protein) synthase